MITTSGRTVAAELSSQRSRYRSSLEIEDPSGALWREAIVRRGTTDKRRREAATQHVAQLQDRDEIAIFELDNDPDVIRTEDAERSYAGQYQRRLRRLRDRASP